MDAPERATPTRYGQAMLRRFGWFYSVLGFGRLLGQVTFEDHSAEQVRSAAEAGPVVYVLQQRSTVDHLALNTVLNRRRLPLSVWANGATSFFWQPVAAAWRDVAHRVRAWSRDGRAPDPVRSGWVAAQVADGQAVTVFLDDQPSILARLRGHSPGDALGTIIDAQSQTDRPIQLLPVMVVWNRAPDVKHGQVRNFLLGNRGAPSFPTQLRSVYARSSEAFVQVGAPVDLKEFLERVPDPARRGRALHTLLRRFLRRESTLVRGPRLLPRRDMQRIVLDNPPMRELARQEAAALGKSYDDVRQQMAKDFDTIAANFKWWMIRAAHVVLRPIWTTIYAGVDVGEEDLDRIREAMRNGTAIIVPCHKSHFDYLLLSWVFYEHNLIVPHVIAGANLAIWPVSVFLRGVGGFFIKRSFSGERVFPAVFARYLRELIRQGYPVEFFIEGGRTRSGKLLPPKVGVLGMVFEATEVRRSGHEVTLLPMALAYEQVAEERSYARELGGEEKKAETVGQLVPAARGVLRRRFGRVYLRVGEPIPIDPLVDGPPIFTDLHRPERKEVLMRVGQRVMHRIGSVMVVLPSSLVALALLAHHRRGIRQVELLARVHRFRRLLQRLGAPEAASLDRFDQAIVQALERFESDKRVRAYDHGGERVWDILPEQRITLEFYKNQVLHDFAPAGFAALAIRGLPDAPFALAHVRPGFAWVIWTLRREFVLDPDCSVTELLQGGLDALVAHGALEADADGLYSVVDPERMGEIYGLFRCFLESYALVLTRADEHLPDDIAPRDYARAIQSEGPNLLASGELTRPEALSLVSLKNAIDSYTESGVLRRSGDRLEADAKARGATLSTLATMVA